MPAKENFTDDLNHDAYLTALAGYKEKSVEVELLSDVWIDDGTGTGATLRVTTNLPVLTEEGLPKLNEKREPIVKIMKRKLPGSIAKILVEQGKAKVPFKMPE